MLVKRRAKEGVYNAAPRRLSDRVKAGLLEPQCPEVQCTPVGITPEADAIDSRTDTSLVCGSPWLVDDEQ